MEISHGHGGQLAGFASPEGLSAAKGDERAYSSSLESLASSSLAA